MVHIAPKAHIPSRIVPLVLFFLFLNFYIMVYAEFQDGYLFFTSSFFTDKWKGQAKKMYEQPFGEVERRNFNLRFLADNKFRPVGGNLFFKLGKNE